ncbi:hypothetical protein GTP91_16620 [Rugamonas sp. FT82W]|uniref:Uncharacterized protein n=1 Tax=Duganella vulcania TaxID=2692166 RepID=A0A845G5P3_9BURK|nr:hypothetical protein [Duganella vulcania]MYM88792.1 hypothetical protein [Duganella vulcania]
MIRILFVSFRIPSTAARIPLVSLAAQLIAAGIACYRIEFPKGMDANDYACGIGPRSGFGRRPVGQWSGCAIASGASNGGRCR